MSSAAETLSPPELEQTARERRQYEERLARRLEELVVERFRPPPDQTVSEWADENRQLSPESSAEPGRWSTDRAPWTRAPMDAARDPETEAIVCCFASQAAKTEIGNNIIGYLMHREPCPMLAVFPTDRMGTTWSKDRLGPMIRDSEPLRGLVIDRRNARIGSGSSEILEKKFPGGLLAITGANSAAGLAMRPIRVLWCDETDRFPASAGGRGGDEGDPLLLGSKRTSNFEDSLELYTSSPGRRDSTRIWPLYESTDRNRWHCPCPDCGREQALEWAQVNFRDSELSKAELAELSIEERAARARYECRHCGALWDDVDRVEAASRGRWIPDRPEITTRRGFLVNALVSPWLTLANLVREWLEAQGDNMALQVFINTRLAELWDDLSDRLDADELLDRVERYPARVPEGVLVVTAGIDVQKNSVEVTRWGWGLSGECWALDHTVLSGDVAGMLRPEESGDDRLDDLLLREKFRRSDGAPLRVSASCIDSGSDAGEFYEDVLAYCRARRRRKVFAVKGRAGQTVPPWPLRATQVKRRKMRGELFVIGVDPIKAALHASLRRKRPEGWEPGDPIPGFLHFPSRPEFDAEYFAQLAAEVPRPYRRKGRIFVEWIQEYPRAEASDCFVYGRAALAALAPNWGRLVQNRKRAATRAREREEAEGQVDDELEGDPDDVEQLEQLVDDDEPAPAKDKPQRERRPSSRRGRRKRRKRGGFVTNW